MMIVPDESLDHSVSPSGEKMTCNTMMPWCSENVASHDPSLVLHSRTVPSSDADATYFPQGEKEALRIGLLCPSSENSSTRVFESQSLTIPFMNAISIRVPSEENAASLAPDFKSPRTAHASPVSMPTSLTTSPSGTRRRVLLESNVVA